MPTPRRLAFIVGAFVLALSCINVPWTYTYTREGSAVVEKPAGYAPLWSPPPPERDVRAAGVEMDAGRLLTLWILIAAVTGGLIALLPAGWGKARTGRVAATMLLVAFLAAGGGVLMAGRGEQAAPPVPLQTTVSPPSYRPGNPSGEDLESALERVRRLAREIDGADSITPGWSISRKQLDERQRRWAEGIVRDRLSEGER
jgi:hypothetical protein